MEHFVLTRNEWHDALKDTLSRTNLVIYNDKNFNQVVNNILSREPDRLTVISDYHPDVPFLISKWNESEKDLLRLEPPLFSHPHCLFSGIFFATILHIYNMPYIPSIYTFSTSLNTSLINNIAFRKLVRNTYSPLSFSLLSLMLALQNNMGIEHIELPYEEETDVRYESLKQEFINSSAVFLSALKDRSIHIPQAPDLNIADNVKFRIPGRNFLRKEFISGFRKYAPFWKLHLYEDHFALLSAIYTGKEEDGIEDRIWIRILLDILRTSADYEDKFKVSRRLFPIYALYLDTIKERPIKEHIENYLSVLTEESKYIEDELPKKN